MADCHAEVFDIMFCVCFLDQIDYRSLDGAIGWEEAQSVEFFRYLLCS